VEIDTTDHDAVGNGPRQDRTITVWKSNTQPVVIRRLYAHDTMRGMDFTEQENITVIDSYHGPNVNPPDGKPPNDPSCPGPDDRGHSSSIRAAGSSHNILIQNTVLSLGECSNASGHIATYTENGASNGHDGVGWSNYDWEISGGMWINNNDGGYGIAAGCDWYGSATGSCAGGCNKYQNYDFNVHDLKISTTFHSEGCPSGCAQGWNNVAGYGPWTNVTKYNPGQADHGQAITAAARPDDGLTSRVCPRSNQ
jgi:hypothetical protein